MLVAQSCPTLCNPMVAKLLCPRDYPGKNTGVVCHAFLQGIFLTQGLKLGLLHCRQILYHLNHQGSISKLNSSKNTNLKLWATIIFYNGELNAMCCFGYTALEKNLDFLSGAVENGLRFNSCCPAVLGCTGLKEGRRGAHSEVCGTNRLRGVNVLYKAHWGVLLFPTVSEEFKISLKGDICI